MTPGGHLGVVSLADVEQDPDDLRFEMERFDYEKINKRVDDACARVLKGFNINPAKLYRYEVEDLMLRMGIPQSLLVVYNQKPHVFCVV